MQLLGKSTSVSFCIQLCFEMLLSNGISLPMLTLAGSFGLQVKGCRH